MRRMPHTMASISSTKAQRRGLERGDDLARRPVGVPPVTEPDQVVVAVGDGAAERAQCGAPVQPAADAPEDAWRRPARARRPRAAARRCATRPACWRDPVSAMRSRRAAKISGAATALASVPSTMAAQLRRRRRDRAASGASSTPACLWSMHSGRGCVHPWGSPCQGGCEVDAGGAHRARCAVSVPWRRGAPRGPTGASARSVVRGSAVSDRPGGGRARRCGTSSAAAPEDGRQDHKAGGVSCVLRRRHACHRGHLASVSWCNPATVAHRRTVARIGARGVDRAAAAANARRGARPRRAEAWSLRRGRTLQAALRTRGATQARCVATRPREVRWIRPLWSRKGS